MKFEFKTFDKKKVWAGVFLNVEIETRGNRSAQASLLRYCECVNPSFDHYNA